MLPGPPAKPVFADDSGNEVDDEVDDDDNTDENCGAAAEGGAGFIEKVWKRMYSPLIRGSMSSFNSERGTLVYVFLYLLYIGVKTKGFVELVFVQVSNFSFSFKALSFLFIYILLFFSKIGFQKAMILSKIDL